MTELNRREVIGALTALPFVNKVDEVKDTTRALVLTVRDGAPAQSEVDIEEMRQLVKTLKKNAGLDVPVIYVQGMTVHVIG